MLTASRVYFFTVLFFLSAGVLAQPSPVRIVRKAGQDEVHTYRIPGVIKTNNGTLIAVYDVRYNTSRDLPGHIDVGMSRSLDDGNSWEPMRIIMDMGAPHENNGVGDPAILYDPNTNTIIVAALWSKGNRSITGSKPGLSPDSTGQLVLSTSTDDGVSWSTPFSITPQVKDPQWHLFFQGPGTGIVMKNGAFVFAAQYWDEQKVPYSTLIYSEDKGKTWKGGIKGPVANTTEAQLVEIKPGTLMINMRDNRGSYRTVATTHDMGQHWAMHSSSRKGLPDPICMASLIKARVRVNGKKREVLFFSNPNSTMERKDLTIKASLDYGETWLPANQVLVDQRPSYGYSSLVQLDEKTIGILYEGVGDLFFAKYPVTEILQSLKKR
jgi:sialidase-1